MSTVERAARLSFAATLLVVTAKLLAGWVSGSISVLAEGLQSLVDVVISLGVVFAVRVAALPADEDHPYGHGRVEVLMSAVQMVLITGTAGFIIAKAAQRLQSPQEIAVDWGLVAMAFSTVLNVLVSAHLARVAKATGSMALKSEVLHLRSDAVSSAGVFVGLVAVAVTQWPILDPLLAIVFTSVVVVAAIRQTRAVVHQLMDGAVHPLEREKIAAVLHTHPEVRGFHALRTRHVGAVTHVDLHVLLDDDLSFVAAHEHAEEIEREISDALGGANVNVHYEPYLAETAHQRSAHSDRPP